MNYFFINMNFQINFYLINHFLTFFVCFFKIRFQLLMINYLQFFQPQNFYLLKNLVPYINFKSELINFLFLLNFQIFNLHIILFIRCILCFKLLVIEVFVNVKLWSLFYFKKLNLIRSKFIDFYNINYFFVKSRFKTINLFQSFFILKVIFHYLFHRSFYLKNLKFKLQNHLLFFTKLIFFLMK